MAKKVLKGQAALDYLKKNPTLKEGANYKVLKNTAKVDPKKYVESAVDQDIQKDRDSRGFFGNLAYDVIKGVSAAPRSLGASLSGKTEGWLDQEEARRFRDDPNKFGLQSIANTASVFVPAFGIGGNIAKAAIGAGASGILQSAGNQDLRDGKSLDVGRLAVDGLTSAAAGGVLSKVGSSIANRARKASVADEVIGTAKNAVQRKARNANLAAKGMKEIGASEGGSLNAVRGFNESADRLTAGLQKYQLPRNERGFGELADRIGRESKEIIPAMRVSVGAPQLIDDITNTALKYIPGVSQQEAKDAVTSYVRNLVDTEGLLNGATLDNTLNLRAPIGSEPLYSMKQATQGFAGGGRPTDLASAIGKAVHDVSGKILGSDGTPILNEAGQQIGTLGSQYTENMRLFADLFQQQDSMINRNPFLSSNGEATVGSVLGGVGSKAKEIGARGVEMAAGGVGNLPRLSKVLNRLQPQNAALRTMAGNTVATGEARTWNATDPAYAEQTQGLFAPQQPITEKSGTAGATDYKTYYGIGGGETTTPQTSELEFYQFYRQQGIPDTQARYMAGVAYEDQLRSNPVKRKRKLTAQDRVAKTRAEFGLEGTFQMRKFLENDIDLSSLSAQQILPNFMKSSDAQKFKVVSDKIADAITRAMTGAALNKEEIDFYTRQVPMFGDTPENIQYKLSTLEEFFQSMYPEEYEDIYK